jgi:hypothetical protein
MSVASRHASIPGKRSVIGAVLTSLVLAAMAVAPVGASTTVSFTIAERGSYACLGPCATATYFNVTGIGHSAALGTMAEVAQGTVLGFDPSTNCLTQSENWALTFRNGHLGKDTLYLSTQEDTFCFTADPNVSHETATFVITGGTGRFANATGSAQLVETVLTHPQIGYGVVTGVMSL